MIESRAVIAAAALSLVAVLPPTYSRSWDRPAQRDRQGQIGHDSVVRIDGVSGAVRAVVPVGPDPLLLRSASGQVWTLNLGDGTLSRIDPSRNRATTVRVGEAVGFASDGKDLWVAVDGNRLLRIDGATGRKEKSLRLGAQPIFALRDAGFLAVGGGSIWLTVPKLGRPQERQTLWRIDPARGRVMAKIGLRRDPLTPLVDGDYVWVVSLSEDAITRVDTRSNLATTFEVGSGPTGLAAGGGSVWVGHDVEREVWRLDPGTAKVRAKIAIDDLVRGLAFGKGRVWVTTATGLQAIDPATNRVTRRIRLTDRSPDEGPIGVAYVDGSVWVSVE